MNAISLTRVGVSSSTQRPRRHKVLGRVRQTFSGAALIDDFFFAGIVAAFLCLTLVLFSNVVADEWQGKSIAAMKIADKAAQRSAAMLATAKTSVKRGFERQGFAAHGFSGDASL